MFPRTVPTPMPFSNAIFDSLLPISPENRHFDFDRLPGTSSNRHPLSVGQQPIPIREKDLYFLAIEGEIRPNLIKTLYKVTFIKPWHSFRIWGTFGGCKVIFPPSHLHMVLSLEMFLYTAMLWINDKKLTTWIEIKK